MTQLDSWGMTGNINTFRGGATAFRNARDLAKQHRDSLIRDANAKASQSQIVAAQDPDGTCDDGDPEPVDRTDYLASQDADDALQQHIADTTYYASEDDEKSVIPRYLSTEDDSQEPRQESEAPGRDELSMSFASSFTSSFTSGLSAKRPRESFNPPSTSKRTFPSTSPTRPGAAGKSGESTHPPQSAPNKYHWVETYWQEGNVSFRDLDGHEFKTEPKDWVEQTVDGTGCFYWQSTKSGREFWAWELPRNANKGKWI